MRASAEGCPDFHSRERFGTNAVSRHDSSLSGIALNAGF